MRSGRVFDGILFQPCSRYFALPGAIFVGRGHRPVLSEPRLAGMIRVLGLGVIISGVGAVQRAIMTRKINFKLLARISIISSVISGSVGDWYGV